MREIACAFFVAHNKKKSRHSTDILLVKKARHPGKDLNGIYGNSEIIIIYSFRTQNNYLVQ